MRELSDIKVELRPIDVLLPYCRNPRLHDEAQVSQIAASMVEFGWTSPILVDGQNGLIAGHGRLLAARKLGLKQVPVIELAHLTETQKRAYVITDNQLTLNSTWDEDLLRVELAALQEADFDLALTGFDDDEIAELLAGEEAPLRATPTRTLRPRCRVTPVSKPGDVWIMGRHRLLCGDSDRWLRTLPC
jgi:ParB-like chromosome segregation protein Spo0J